MFNLSSDTLSIRPICSCFVFKKKCLRPYHTIHTETRLNDTGCQVHVNCKSSLTSRVNFKDLKLSSFKDSVTESITEGTSPGEYGSLQIIVTSLMNAKGFSGQEQMTPCMKWGYICTQINTAM